MSVFHILYTRESLIDPEEIYLYSQEKWGRQVADSYEDSLFKVLGTLEEYPGLLRKSEFSDALRIYVAERHTLYFALRDDECLLLAVRYGAMNAERIFHELEPRLVEEMEVMHSALKKRP